VYAQAASITGTASLCFASSYHTTQWMVQVASSTNPEQSITPFSSAHVSACSRIFISVRRYLHTLIWHAQARRYPWKCFEVLAWSYRLALAKHSRRSKVKGDGILTERKESYAGSETLPASRQAQFLLHKSRIGNASQWGCAQLYKVLLPVSKQTHCDRKFPELCSYAVTNIIRKECQAHSI